MKQYLLRAYQAAGATVAARNLHVGYHRKGTAGAPVVVLLHGLGCTHEVWEDTIKKLPGHMSVVALDLLGFGNSPRPRLPLHHNYIHARSVIKTLRKLNYTNNIILVGHSLGGLIAIEAARQRPDMWQQLILCGPPIYHSHTAKHTTKKKEEKEAKLLKSLYSIIADSIEGDEAGVIKAAALIKSTGLAPKAVEINQHTITPYILALRHSIIRQTSFTDMQSLRVPTIILYGLFDPLVLHPTIKKLAYCPHITTKRILASHELTRGYVRQICKRIDSESSRK